MLRLTLRSGRDGRFLARVIDRNGLPFVLDYGDAQTVRAVTRLVLQGGFRVSRGGVWETATPQHPELLLLLAHHYAEQGMLVFLEEPTWGGRGALHPHPPAAFEDADEPEATDATEETEVLSIREAMVATRAARLAGVGVDDLPTEELKRPALVPFKG